MKERPILFSAPMVNAILAGRKTQTRRIVKVAPPKGSSPGDIEQDEDFADEWFYWIDGGLKSTTFSCPYGQPGDRLWVRETLCRNSRDSWGYKADGEFVTLPANDAQIGAMYSWAHHKAGDTCVSIHMPRWASRIALEIAEVRVERLNDISIEDAEAEGLASVTKDGSMYKYGIPDRDGLPGTDDDGWPWMHWRQSPVDAYEWLWQSIHGGGSWASNPWVWALTFKRVQP